MNLTNASRTLNAWCYYDFLSVHKALRCDKHQFRDKNDGEQLNRFRDIVVPSQMALSLRILYY